MRGKKYERCKRRKGNVIEEVAEAEMEMIKYKDSCVIMSGMERL